MVSGPPLLVRPARTALWGANQQLPGMVLRGRRGGGDVSVSRRAPGAAPQQAARSGAQFSYALAAWPGALSGNRWFRDHDAVQGWRTDYRLVGDFHLPAVPGPDCQPLKPPRQPRHRDGYR